MTTKGWFKLTFVFESAICDVDDWLLLLLILIEEDGDVQHGVVSEENLRDF